MKGVPPQVCDYINDNLRTDSISHKHERFEIGQSIWKAIVIGVTDDPNCVIVRIEERKKV